MPNLADALALAQKGMFIFPCQPAGKQPLVKWRDDSSTDPATITNWWHQWPDANIGIDCGKSRLVVIDEDKAGALWEFEADNNGVLGQTLTAKTGKGSHLYYRAPVGAGIRNSAGTLFPHIDVRAEGGYVIAPPSVHPDGGTYQWSPFRDIADLDQWVLDLLTAKPEPAKIEVADVAAGQGQATSWGQTVLDAECGRIAMSVEGQRNTVLYQAALKVWSAMLGGQIDEDYAAGQLFAAGRRAGLDDDEIERTLRSALEDAQPRQPEPRPERPETPPHPAEQVREVLARHEQEAPPAAPERPEIEKDRPSTFKALNLLEIETLPPPRWLLEERLPEGLAVLYGEPGAGKTFIALDWALLLSSIQDQPIIYFAGEGVSGLASRIQAWRSTHHYLKPDQFLLVPQVPRLLDPASVELLANTVREHRPALVVLDTLARCLVGGDENSALDVGSAIDVLDRLRLTYGTSSLILHHAQKNGGRERGSGALRGAADVMWKASEQTGEFDVINLECEKLKDGKHPGEVRHMFRQVGESVVLHQSTAEMLGVR